MVFQRFVFPECSSGRLGRTRSVAYFNVLYCGAAYGSRFVMVAYGAVLQTLITREGRVARRLTDFFMAFMAFIDLVSLRKRAAL